MAQTTFGVTAELVRSGYFPYQPTFDGTTVPTATAVAVFIDEEAVHLTGRLLVEGITASSLTAGDDAYVWASGMLRLMAAIRVVQAGIAMDPQVLDDWKARVAERFDYLDKNGRRALGVGVSDPTIEPNGPTTHLDTYGIETPDIGDMSPIGTILRRSDEL